MPPLLHVCAPDVAFRSSPIRARGDRAAGVDAHRTGASAVASHVPPDAMVMLPLERAAALLARRVPPLIVVPPVYVLLVVRVSVPIPVLPRIPLPVTS